MLRVGLTGSIAVGKSFVSGVFAELGCSVLDADETARDVVLPGSPALQDLVKKFGAEIQGNAVSVSARQSSPASRDRGVPLLARISAPNFFTRLL